MKKLIFTATVTVILIMLLSIGFTRVNAYEKFIMVDNWEPVGSPGDECANASKRTGVRCQYHAKLDFNLYGGGTFYFPFTLPDGTTLTLNITIESDANGYRFNWISNYTITTIIVKGGTGANIFFYGVEGAMSDTGLYAYGNKEISHVTFCWNPPPNQVIPDVPLGTVAAMVAMIAAFGAYFVLRKPKPSPL